MRGADQDAGFVPYDVMEEAVRQKTAELLRQCGRCCCEECRNTVKARALSELPAMRAVCIREEVCIRYALLEEQLQVDIAVAVLRAMEETGAQCPHAKPGISASG